MSNEVSRRTTVSEGIWTNLRSDPNPIEALSASIKLIVAFIIAWRVSGLDPVGLPPPSGGLIDVLGSHALYISVLLIVHALAHFGALVHNSLTARRVCAALSLSWWLFFAQITWEVRGSDDLRFWLFVIVFIFNIWVQWRLWLTGRGTRAER